MDEAIKLKCVACSYSVGFDIDYNDKDGYFKSKVLCYDCRKMYKSKSVKVKCVTCGAAIGYAEEGDHFDVDYNCTSCFNKTLDC